MPSPRLPVYATDVNALRDRDSQEREEMLQSLAICAQRQRPINGKYSPTAVRSIANRLHVVEEAVYHQCDGQTISNPLVELCAWIDGARAAGKPDEHALAPLAWLIRRYQPESVDQASRADMAGSCACALAGASSVIQTALDSISDAGPGGEHTTTEELRKYRQARLSLDRQLQSLDAQMEARARAGQGREAVQ